MIEVGAGKMEEQAGMCGQAADVSGSWNPSAWGSVRDAGWPHAGVTS